jgi:hypothetical protein
MGSQLAQEISDFDMPLRNQIEIHLVSNFYPPVPRFMAQTCVDALNAYWEEDTKRMIDMPKRVSYKGSTSAPAWAIVEQHRLWPWLQEDEDYNE